MVQDPPAKSKHWLRRLKRDMTKNPMGKLPEICNVLTAIMLRMWFVFMLLACPFASADDIIKNAVFKKRPLKNAELQFRKPPDIVDVDFLQQRINDMEQQSRLQRKYVLTDILGNPDFLSLQGSRNDDRGVSCLAPLNTNALSDQEIRQLRNLLCNLQTASSTDDTNGGFDVVMDSGTTWNVTFSPADFISDIRPVPEKTSLRGIARSLPITGVGTLEWNVIDDTGLVRSIQGTGYLVPDLNLRLCSPQSYFLETKGGELRIRGTESLFQ